CMVSYKGDLYKLLLVQIMAASAIIISFDSSDESVGSPPSWVILFGDIPTVIPSTFVIAPETYAIAHVISSATHVVETSLVASITGRPYRTRPNRPRRVMTARKRVGPLPARRLSWRRASPRSSNHHPSSSSLPTDSSPVHSSESSSGDSSERPLHSSSHYAGLSRKRCRSPTNYVPSSTPVIGSLAPTHADLLPPRKRFRDSYSSEASIEEDTEDDPTKTE
nr:hypothetical protein [Tanacetum cinerariifolium]